MATGLRSLLLTSICVAAFSLVSGCSEPDDPGQMLAQAKELRASGKNNEAVIQLRNALQIDPNMAEARYLLGVTYYDSGNPTSSEKELRKALELGFDPEKVWPVLASAMVTYGQFKKALDETESAAKTGELLAVRGHAELGLGRLQDAARSFDAALKLKPEFGPALLGQARLAIGERNFDKAQGLVNSVLASTPKDVDALLLGADIYSLQANHEQAAAVYGRVLEIQPENATAHLRRATALADAGKFEAAHADINAARRISPGDVQVDYALASLLYRSGKPGPAREAVQRVLKVAPDHMPSVILAGVLEFNLGSPELAERHAARFVERYPGNVFARKLLAAIMLNGNKAERALQVMQPALKQAPQDGQLLALAGEAYMQLRDYSKATDYLEQSAALRPDAGDVRVKLGISRLALGEDDRALAELGAAVELDRVPSQADTLLVMIHLRRKEYDKALDAALKLQKKQPENPVGYNLLGGAYLGKNDLANARKSFERALSLKPDYLPAAMLLTRLDLQAKDPDSARKRFKTILEKDRNNVGAMIGLASIERATGNADGYVSWLEEARKADATALAPRILLARHYLFKRDLEKALFVAAEAKTIQPSHPDVLSVLGEAQAANDDKAGAVATYASLANAVPLSRDAHYSLAMAHIANENYAAATESLKRALRLKPDYVEAEAALGLLEYKAGRYNESLRLAQEIQRHDPNVPVGYSLEGDSLMAQQKFAAAEKAFEKAFARRQSAVLATKLHAALSQAGKAKQADDRLLQWQREHPADTVSRLYLADRYVSARKYQLAIEQYREVLKQDPKNVLALNNIATLYLQQNDPVGLSYLERSYSLKPDSIAIADNLGWALVEQGQVPRGLELLARMAAKAPDNTDVRYHLAAALAKSGQKAQARGELERLLAEKGNFRYRNEAQALLKQL